MRVGRDGVYQDLKEVLLGALRVQPGRWYLRVDLVRYVELVGANGREYESTIAKHVSTAMGEVFGKGEGNVSPDGHYVRTGYGTLMTAYTHTGRKDFPNLADPELGPYLWSHLVGMRPQHWGPEFLARWPGRCLWPGCGERIQVGCDVLRIIQFSYLPAPTLAVHARHAPADPSVRRRGELLPTEKGAIRWR